MPETNQFDRVWEIIEKVGVCMLTTSFEGGLRARPLEARPDRSFGRLLFVTDVHSAKRDEVDRRPNIGLVFIDVGAKAYLSITGTARVTDDPELRAAASRKNDVVWWPGGPADPDGPAERTTPRGRCFLGLTDNGLGLTNNVPAAKTIGVSRASGYWRITSTDVKSELTVSGPRAETGTKWTTPRLYVQAPGDIP